MTTSAPICKKCGCTKWPQGRGEKKRWVCRKCQARARRRRGSSGGGRRRGSLNLGYTWSAFNTSYYDDREVTDE